MTYLKEEMGSKSKKAAVLGSPVGFKSRNILRYLFFSIVLLFTVTFFGNVLSVWVTLIPWHTAAVHLISCGDAVPSRGDAHLSPDCSLRNVSGFDMKLWNYTMDDSRHQNVTQLSRIKKIYTQNEAEFSMLNKRLISMVSGDLPMIDIHERFRGILITRGTQSSSKAGVMKDILPTVKRQMDEHYLEETGEESELLDPKEGNEATLQRYESCAVVGNSGVLWNSSRGMEIDSHEMVIRLNNAFSRERDHTKLETHIGLKTTLTFMNSHILRQCLRRFHHCQCHPYGEWVPIMVYLCTPEHALDIACCSLEHKTPLFLTDGKFDAFVSRLATWYSIKYYLNSTKGSIKTWEDAHRHEFHYSSGFQAVVTALALCEKVDLYGFGKHPQWKHHFHTNKNKEHYAHDFEGEYLFYSDLEANRIYDNPYLCEAGTYIPRVQVFHTLK